METQINKSKLLRASISLVNDRLMFSGQVEGNPPVTIDYISPLGDDAGYTSLELLLLSLSSCLGSALLTFLRRMQKTILGCEIQATGLRNETHPTGFKHIEMVITLKSNDLAHEEVAKVIKMAEETYCPVWAMVRGNVDIATKVVIHHGD